MTVESGNSSSTTTTPNSSLDSLPTIYKWIIKVVIILMTIGGFALGISTLISVNPLCVVSGIIYLLEGVLVLALELPIIFSCVNCLAPLIKFSEGRPGWQKALIYIILPVIGISMCYSISSIFAFIIYALISIAYVMIDVMNRRRR